MNSFEAFSSPFVMPFYEATMVDGLSLMRDFLLNQLSQELSLNRILLSNSCFNSSPVETSCSSPPTKIENEDSDEEFDEEIEL